MIKKNQHGFTLIELLTVVAVVGVLAGIAYPSYTESVLKGKRAQARTALSELLQQQERYATQNNTYLKFGTLLSGGVITTTPTSASTTFKLYVGDDAKNPPYILSADLCTTGTTPTIAECVLVSAAPTKADAVVGTLRITSTGTKDCTGTANSSNPKLCWP
jgi:type IV pilus assembly protein PilE